MNCDVLIGSLIAVGGVVIGAVLTFLLQRFLNKQTYEYDKDKMLMEKKLDIYPKAILYISKCCLFYTFSHSSIEVQKEIEEECTNLYNDFHPLLSLLCDEKTINEFNSLRNDCYEGRIKIEDAYSKVLDMLGRIK